MFELKLKLQKRLIKKKLIKSQEKVSSQVTDKTISGRVISSVLKLSVLVFFGLIVLFPFIFMVLISFMNDKEAAELSTNAAKLIPSFGEGQTFLYVEGNPNLTGLSIQPWAVVVANTYKRAITSGYFSSLGLTTLNVIVSVFFKIIVTFLLGYAFAIRKWRGKGFVIFVSLALLVLPEVALLSGQYVVVVKTGLNLSYFKFVLAMALPFTASIFNTIMYKNAFEAIPGRIKEVSAVDGAIGLKYMVKVAFPMVMPTTLTIGILTALASWNAYLWPSVIATAGRKLEVISVWLFKAGIDPNYQDAGPVLLNIKMAAALLVILPVFVFYLIFRKRIMAAISRQGSTIKG
ncbi:carbohydrate ABC transporter permease [Mycoplasma leonicaptivi]|uniref:carbohydrate ABC transporter permease n=1 Tax=Mycoplasma leonicaptivi TaxID=36742 RepID=UPI0004894FEF|nr:carbohydrate ABC transporter permease [Mycoplasma leonicaptivi]